MRGTGFAVLLCAAFAAAQEGPREFQVRPLGFSVAVPVEWTAEQGTTGMVARDPKDNGFLVTREPFLHDEDTFAAAWRAQLSAAKVDALVERTKAGGREAWHAAWTAGDRRIEVWRVYVPESEMLYNFSFSAAAGFDLKPLADATLKSFKCAPAKAELKFQPNAESVSPRIGIRLPEGYEKEPPAMGPELGGGIMGGFVKTLKGYDPPHVAGRIRFRGLEAGVTYGLPNGRELLSSDTEKVIDYVWQEDQPEFAPATRKPKTKDMTCSGFKGSMMDGPVVGKDGLPRRWMAFVGKYKQDVVEIIILVDAREARLHKDLLKQVCSNLVIAK